MTDSIPPLVNRARLQLMLSHPFLAAATARYPMVNGDQFDWCDTMATDGYFIYVNSGFCEKLTEKQVMAVLAHEVMHCVLGHMDRRKERDRYLWNVAIDYATNLFLTDYGFELPRGALLDHGYRGRTAEDIYRKILDDGLMSETHSASEEQSEHGGLERRLGQRSHLGGDLHLDPSDIEGVATRQDGFPSEVERRRIRISLANGIKSNIYGRAAGYFAEEIKSANTAHISWQSILARFFNGLRKNDYSMFPFNKKHAWRNIYLPSIGAPGPEHIIVAVDTSGSMQAKELSMVLAELDQLRSMTECKLTLLECDAEIKEIQQFEAWELSRASFKSRAFKGRGGTNLNPPIDWAIKRFSDTGELPDALFYMTDGYGSMPTKPPPFPIYWVVPKHGQEKFPFGEVLRLG